MKISKKNVNFFNIFKKCSNLYKNSEKNFHTERGKKVSLS